MKNKRILYYNHKDRALKLERKYNLFILVLNGNNVEIETDKINEEIKDNNEKLKILLSRPFIEKVVRGYFKVTEIKYTDYDSLPHIHIILFTIKGIYKHFKISEFKNMIMKEWKNLKGFNANAYLKSLGTKKKIEKEVSYLTRDNKKQLYNLFNLGSNVVKVHLEVTRNKRFFVWSKNVLKELKLNNYT